MDKVRIYVAGPLFSHAERSFNRALADALEARIPNCVVRLPQEHARIIADKAAFAELMFDYCLRALDDSDIVVAVLDGPDVDAGTCVEIGYAYAGKKPVVGFRTDFRASEDRGVNLMVSKACTDLVWLPATVIDQDRLFSEVISAVERILFSNSATP